MPTLHLAVVDARPVDYLQLQDEGVALTFFPSGEAAVRAVGTTRADAWMIACHLPSRDGLDLVRVLRTRRVQSPLFLVAGPEAVEGEELAALAAGAHFVRKPLEPAWFKQIEHELQVRRSMTSRPHGGAVGPKHAFHDVLPIHHRHRFNLQGTTR